MRGRGVDVADRVRVAIGSVSMTPDTVVPCTDLDAAVADHEARGYRIELVVPADDPRVVVMSRDGAQVQLQRDGAPAIELFADPPVIPPLVASFTISRGGAWHAGRAGMHYRDLLPDRQGGRFIASHIRIVDGGPVPDYVHHHAIRFQLIYCYRGWVRLVYEDQGEPFVMREGDCVLQPPNIRHRVLESSAGLEVIEVGCPAVHATRADHDLALPTRELRPERMFGGQQFVWHRAATAVWVATDEGEVRDLELGVATGGIVIGRVVRGIHSAERRHTGELRFGFVLRGGVEMRCAGEHVLRDGDAFAIPPGQPYALTGADAEILLLDVP
jgi:quercetin dioxygenase-like cupin family protein